LNKNISNIGGGDPRSLWAEVLSSLRHAKPANYPAQGSRHTVSPAVRRLEVIVNRPRSIAALKGEVSSMYSHVSQLFVIRKITAKLADFEAL
jgi:hypothetical protein